MLIMQSQMEKGFSALCDKISSIEQRVDQAQLKLDIYERAGLEEQKLNQQKDM